MMEAATGNAKLDGIEGAVWLSRYSTLSHQAGIRFFSLESYPKVERENVFSAF